MTVKRLGGKRRIIAPVGRGRTGKTTLTFAIYEAMVRRGMTPTVWDLDVAPSLQLRVKGAHRPSGSSDSARRHSLESAITETVKTEQDALVDMGADDLLFHQIQDKLPEVSDMLAECGIEVVAPHVLGPDPFKDTAFFRATKDTGVFDRQFVCLNHGLVPDDVDPDAAFENVRKIAQGFRLRVIRKLPPIIVAAIQDHPEMTLDELASDGSWFADYPEDERPTIIDLMVLRNWLSKSIKPIVDEILGEEPTPEAAE